MYEPLACDHLRALAICLHVVDVRDRRRLKAIGIGASCPDRREPGRLAGLRNAEMKKSSKTKGSRKNWRMP